MEAGRRWRRSTGRVTKEDSGADGYAFKDAKTGELKEVSGDCNVTYGEASHTLNPGDLVLIYSDGFSEAMNRRFEEYGEDRLLETLVANRSASAEAIIDRCFAAVKEHCGDAPQTDDMTMVAVRVCR